MFEYLKDFSKIIVSGPQRSGTRICAKMIAHDLNYRYVDEGDIGVDSLNRLWGLWHRQKSFVVQCPALSRYVHLFADDDTAIVFMIRDIDDIVASQKRVGWSWGIPELLRYDIPISQFDVSDPATTKYAFWLESQKHLVGANGFEVKYESLRGHPLWLDKEQRLDFKSSQTMSKSKKPDRRQKKGKIIKGSRLRREQEVRTSRKAEPDLSTKEWPPVTVLIVTYDRPDEIRRVIAALEQHLVYNGELRWHIADDGSPEGYLDNIMLDFSHLNVATSISRRAGWGANVNRALKSLGTEYAFLCEDDYVALRDLNLSQGIALLEARRGIALVRYDGVQGHELTLHLTDTKTGLIPGKTHYMVIDKKSPHRNVYSNRPHLVHVKRFHGAYGWYPEGKKLGITESMYAQRVKRRRGPDVAILVDGVPDAFEHIGQSRQNTELDVGR